MSADPTNRLPAAFGKLLMRLRTERKLTQEALAKVADLSPPAAVTKMELGEREPTLMEFFRIANAVGAPPAILFMDMVQAWRFDPSDAGYYKSRTSDINWIYRLGYYRTPGDFRELPRTYGSIDAATGAANTLNAARKAKQRPLLDTVLVYVRLESVSFRSDVNHQLHGGEPTS